MLSEDFNDAIDIITNCERKGCAKVKLSIEGNNRGGVGITLHNAPAVVINALVKNDYILTLDGNGLDVYRCK